MVFAFGLFPNSASAAEEDCIEAGGTYTCISPIWKETPATGGDGYERFACDVAGAYATRWAAWCKADGGVFGGTNVGCIGGNSAIYDDGDVLQRSIGFLNALYFDNCDVSLTSNSRWGATRVGDELCGNGQTVYDGAEEVKSLIEYSYSVSARINGVCAPPRIENFLGSRIREKICPAGYRLRKRASGLTECYLAPPCENCGVGNPIDPSNGTKRQVEVDYRSPAASGLDLIRYYSSAP